MNLLTALRMFQASAFLVDFLSLQRYGLMNDVNVRTHVSSTIQTFGDYSLTLEDLTTMHVESITWKVLMETRTSLGVRL